MRFGRGCQPPVAYFWRTCHPRLAAAIKQGTCAENQEKKKKKPTESLACRILQLALAREHSRAGPRLVLWKETSA